MKKIKDKSSAILVLIAVVASMVTMLNAIYLYLKIDYEDSAIKYNNSLLYNFCAYSNDDNKVEVNIIQERVADFYDEIDTLSLNCDVNAKLSNIFLLIGNSNTAYNIDLYIINNTAIKEKASGENIVFNEDEIGVYVGNVFEQFLFVDNEIEYITIEGVDCKVLGVLDNISASGEDARIIVNWNNIPEELKKRIINCEKTYYFEYNELSIMSDTDIGEAEDKIVSIFDDTKMDYHKGDIREKQNQTDFLFLAIKKTVICIAIIFSVGCCLATISVWGQRKHREVAIRRIFGYSYLEIAKIIIPQLMLILVVGSLIGGIIFFIQYHADIIDVMNSTGIIKMLLGLVVSNLMFGIYGIYSTLYALKKGALLDKLHC